MPFPATRCWRQRLKICFWGDRLLAENGRLAKHRTALTSCAIQLNITQFYYAYTQSVYDLSSAVAAII